MSELKSWHNEIIATKTVAALMKNDFQATYCSTRQEAAEQILALIPMEGTIGVGGSWTTGELGLLDKLDARGSTIFNHSLPDLTAEEKNGNTEKTVNL